MINFLPSLRFRVCAMIFIFLISNSQRSFSQVTGDYESLATGNWSIYTNWNIYNGTAWVAATAANGYPGQNSATSNVTILAGKTITLDVTPADAIASLQLGGTTTGSGAGAITFSSGTQLTVNGTVTLGSAAARTGTLTMTSGGTLFAQGFAVNAVTGNNIWTPGTGTVELTATNTLPASLLTSFNNLIINAGTTTLGEAISITSALTVASGSILNASTYIVSFANTGETATINGTFETADPSGFSGTTNTAIKSTNTPTITLANTSTVLYSAPTGGQTVTGALAYNNLSFSNGSGTNSANANIAVNGTLTTSAGGTFDLTAAFILSGMLSTVANSGTISTEVPTATSATPIPAGINWGSAGAITYGSTAGGQTVVAGAYFNINFLGNPTKTLSGNITVGGALTINAGAVDVSASNYSITISGNWVNNSAAAAFTAESGTVTFNGATQAINGSKRTEFYNLSVTGGTTTVGVDLNTILNTLSVASASTLDASTYTLAFNATGGAATINGTFRTANTAGFSGASAAAISSANTPTITLANTSTVEYSATTGGQTVTGALPYNSLKFDNTSGTNSANANIVVNGTLTTTSGGVFDLTAAYTLSGTLATISNSGTISTEMPTATSATPIPVGLTWGGTITYGSTSGSQTLVSGTYNNLTLSGSAGSVLGGAATVNSTLSITAGILTLGTYNITIASSGTVSGSFSTTAYIMTNSSGQLKQTVGSSQVTFPIGDSYYDPLQITNTGTSGVYGVNAVDGAPPSLWDPTKVVNVTWVVSQATSGGVLSLVAGWQTAQQAANFAAGTTPEIGLWNGTSWSQVTATQTGNTFNSSPNTFSSVGTFAVGKDDCFTGSPTTYYSGTTGTLDQLTTWWTNSNGTGTHPSDFVAQSQTYLIQTSANLGANWTVTGTGSVINVGNGSTLTPTFTVGGANVLTVNSGAVINVNASSILFLSTTGTLANITPGTLSATSTVNFASTAAQTIPALNYGNLTSSSSGSRTLAGSGTIGIAGTFTPSTNSYTITGSTINFNGTGQTIPAFNYYNLANTNNITLAGTGNIGIEGSFTIGGTYTVSGSTVVFNGQAGDANQTVPLISSSDLGSGVTAGGYYNLTIASAVTTYLPYTTGSSALGNTIPIYGTLSYSGTGQLVFNNASTAGNVNTFYIGAYSSTPTSGIANTGSLVGAGTCTIYVYGNFINNGTVYTNSTGNNAIIEFSGTSASPQQFVCASGRQVWFYINNGAVVNMTGNVIIGSASQPYPAYLIVYSGATLNMGPYIISSQDATRAANAYFVLESGGTLGIGSPYGITTNISAGAVNAGNIQLFADSTSTLYRSFSSGANYVYNGTSSQVTGVFSTTPTASTVKNLYIENASGVTLSQATSISTGLYIGNIGSASANITQVLNSIFADGGNQVTSTGTLNLGTTPYAPVATITNASQFILGSATAGTTYPAFGTNSIGAGTTVQYNSGNGIAQTVLASPAYYNLSIVNSSGTGSSTKTLSGNLTVYGSLSNGANGTLDAGASNYNITVDGNWANSGTFNARSATVTFNGGGTNSQIQSATQTVTPGTGSTTTFYTLVNNSTYTVQLAGNATTGNTFTNGSSASVFNAATFTHTVTALSTINGGNYQAGTGLQTFTGGLTVAGGTFTGQTGPVTVGSSTLAGAVTLSSGTLIAPSGTFSVYGNWAQTSGTTFTSGTGGNTVTFTMPSSLSPGTQTINSGGGSNSSFNNINHAGSGILQITTNALVTNGTFTNNTGSGNFDANGQSHTVTGLATVLASSYLPKTAQQTFNGGLTINGSTATFNGLVNSLVSATNVTITSGTLTAPGSSGTFTVSGNFSNSGVFTNSSGTVTFNGTASGNTISGSLTTTNEFYNLTVNGSAGGWIFSNSADIKNNVLLTTGSLTGPTAGNLNVGLNWTNNGGSFTPSTSTVTFYGAVAQAIKGSAAAQTFYNVTTANSGTALSVAGSTATLNLNGSMTIGLSTTLAAGTATAINVGANWTDNTATSAGGFTPASSKVTFDGGIAANINGSATGQTFFNMATSTNNTALSVAGSTATVTLKGGMTIGSATTIAAGTASTINVAANWTDNTSTGSGGFTPGSGTVYFNGATTQSVNGSSSAQTFNNFTLSNSATSVSAAGSTTKLTLNGTMTINSNTTMAAGTAANIYVAANWSNLGTYNAGTGTVTFNAPSSSTTQNLNAGSSTFYNLVNNTAGTLLLYLNSLVTSNNFTNITGTFNANSLGHAVGSASTNIGSATISGGTYTASSQLQSFNGGLTISGGTFDGTNGGSGTAGSQVAAYTVLISSGTITAPSAVGSFNVTGNWTYNGGTFTANGGTVNFNNTSGSTAQTIGGTQSTIFNGLMINNSAGVTFIDGNLKSKSVNGALTLTAGLLTTDAHDLLILGGSATTNLDAPPNVTTTYYSTVTSYINGPVQRTLLSSAPNTSVLFFPVGQSAIGYVPLSISQTTPASTQTYTGQYIHTYAYSLGPVSPASLPQINHVSGCDYWRLDLGTTYPATSNSSLPTGTTANITMYWNPNNSKECQTSTTTTYVTNLPTLAIAHLNFVSGQSYSGLWAALGNTYTFGDYSSPTQLTSNSIEYVGVSTFSPFALATSNGANNPLPILLDYLTAIKEAGYNKITWKAECNSSSSDFVLERSYNGIEFSSIDSVHVTDTSDCIQPFIYNDYTATGTRDYYRVRIVDVAGNITYSDIVMILNEGNALQMISIRPNPATTEAWLTISASQNNKVELSILDITGRELERKTIEVMAGSNSIDLQIGNFAKGMYIVKAVYNNGESSSLPFIKQ